MMKLNVSFQGCFPKHYNKHSFNEFLGEVSSYFTILALLGCPWTYVPKILNLLATKALNSIYLDLRIRKFICGSGGKIVSWMRKMVNILEK